jgi:hypothetical protein
MTFCCSSSYGCVTRWAVLSVYDDAQDPRTAAIEVKNRLSDLERRLASNGSVSSPRPCRR